MEEEDFKKLSIEDACNHKVWKARLIGYEAALKQFELIEDEKSNEWMKYVGLVKKFVVDSHALCQEKGLEAVLIFVENCGVAGRTTGDVVSGIIQKCLAAPKARTKELGSQVILMYIEIEKYEIVVEELLKGTESKNPKVVAACVHVLAQALKEFGPKVINVSKLLKRVPPLLEDRDKVVRQETKMLAYEVYHWLGPTIKPQLTAILKPAQLAEMESEYEKVKDTPAKATRLLRSQQVKKAAAGSGGDKTDSGVSDPTSGDGVVEEADPFEFLEPVDILSQLNKEFYTKLESKKWVDRKDVLEELDKLLEVSPKLENADYGELLRTLKKVIQKDSNVVVVAFAVKCVTGIANGLKKKFHQYATFIMPALLEKFKEKKQNVNSALKDAVDAVYWTTNLDALHEDILTYLDNKNPNVKSGTCEFLHRCLSKSSPSAINKKLLKSLCKGLTNCVSDQDPTVRHNAAVALGTIMKLVGEKAIGPFIVDLEPTVLKKVKEHCENVKIVSPPGEKVSKPEKSSDAPEKPVVKPKVVNKSKPVKPLPASSSQPVTEVKHLSREEALNVAKNIIPTEVYEGMLSDEEEKQDAACEKLTNILNTIPIQDETGQALLALFALHDFTLPGISLVSRMELLKRIVEKYPIPRDGMALLLFEISNQLTNPSCAKYATDILTTCAKRTSLADVAELIFGSEDFTETVIEAHAKLWAEKINWMAHAIMTIGVMDDPSFVFEFGRKASLHSNSNVRNAGLALIGIVHLKGNNSAQSGASDIASQDSSVIPVKNVVPSQKSVEKEKSPEKAPEKVAEQPKVDISTKITENMLAELADKNWKVRAEAVSKLQSIISSAHSITGNLGDAAPLIAARIQDSNAKISSSAISLVESLAPAMGPSCKRYIPVFLPALMKAIGDQKIWVRSAVIPCLNTWGDVIGYEKFFEGEIIADALKSGTPAVRAELWSWLSAKLPDIPPKSFPKEELVACLSVLYSNFEDRSAEVRKNACECALGFMLHLGYNNMVQAVDNIKGSGNSARVIKEILDKTRGSLPIVPLQKSKSGSCSSEKSSSRPSTVRASMGPTTGSVKSKKASIPPSRSIPSLRGKKEEDDLPLLQINNLKHQRVIDEQKLKILKWHFVGAPRPEFIELLKELMNAANVNKTLIANMFHVDFRYHLRAIENLAEDLHVNKEAMKCNLDLILRWMTLRFFDTNPSVLLKGLEYLNAVFSVLIEEEYTMLDSEANGFIPYLILKVGDPKDAVRNSVRLILKQISSVYPSSKQFAFLTEGVKSKNARQRSECLDQMAWLIDNHGISVCHPSLPAAMREIAKHIGDRDHTVRNAALNCVVATYFIEGEKVLKMIDKMSEKDSFLLEERIRRASKNKPLNVVKPLLNEEAMVKPMSADSAPTVDSSESNTTMVTCYSQFQLEESDHNETFNQTVIAQTIPTTAVTQTIPTTTVVAQTIPTSVSSSRTRPSSGAYGFDLEVVEDIECVGSHFNTPKLVDIDLQFLKDSSHQSSFKPIHMPKMTPTLSNYSQPSAIKRELINIASSDIDKSMSAIAKIDTIILSDKRNLLIEFADHLVSQLVHLIIILNQSAHPEVVNCYNATFSLFMKFCNSKDLCSQLTEPTLYKILEQFLLLLSEPRMDNKQNMFGRVVNNLIIRFLEQSNKTNVMCALFQILYSCVSNPKATNHFKDLVVKCLWKLNKTLPEWDSELDYTRVLTEFNIFLKDYPTSWWKNEATIVDFPLRTLKTLLHTMIRIRGVEVRRIAERMPNISEDSELYLYIRRIVKHVRMDEIRQEIRLEKEQQQQRAAEEKAARESNVSRESQGVTPRETQQRLTKEEQDELSEIFRMIGEYEDTQEGIKRLYLFKRANPHANIDPFLDRTNSQFQWYVRKGIKTYEEEEKALLAGTCRKENTTSTESQVLKDKEIFSEEAEVLWTKLKSIQEKSGCQLEKNKEESSEQLKEQPKTVIESTPDTEPSDIASLKKRFEKFKYGSNL